MTNDEGPMYSPIRRSAVKLTVEPDAITSDNTVTGLMGDRDCRPGPAGLRVDSHHANPLPLCVLQPAPGYRAPQGWHRRPLSDVRRPGRGADRRNKRARRTTG